MKCPSCKGSLQPWPEIDGGYQGVKCVSCVLYWYSDDFALKAYYVEKIAVDRLVDESSFPTDATQPDDRGFRPYVEDGVE